jgi:hypothetical protein
MLTIDKVKEYISYCKEFWNVQDFSTEILNWKFETKHPKNLIFNIGHPINSHKGSSIGDILPYTRLPEVIKERYPNATITVPKSFTPIFKNNPFVDNFNGKVVRWGSLGTWGTSVQRTCNVWGFKTFKFTPIIYNSSPRIGNKLLFCVNSKTGGRIKNIKLFENIIEELKLNYHCVQLGLKDDPIIKNADEYVFNVSSNNLIEFVSQFKTYIGSQNSIYHVAKALNLAVIGILPENVIPELVVLPLLTQVNHLELEMLSKEERIRSNLWKSNMASKGINPDESHHIGWLYPDSVHLTERQDGTDRCPPLSVNNINNALNNKIYPFNDSRLWDIDKYRDLWI